jgi:RNA polymerase sigma factor (TIGR02999 family)
MRCGPAGFFYGHKPVSAQLCLQSPLRRVQWTTPLSPESKVNPMHEVSQILAAINDGDPQAAEQLLPLVYDELRRLAREKMTREKPGQTLQATALVHEAYLRLVDTKTAQQWENRRHFLAAAAEAMRRILIENARRKKSDKAGGGLKRIDLDDSAASVDPASDDLLALDDALVKLANEDKPAADLAARCLFAGLTVEEAAEQLGISRRTGFRHWAYARAFLQIEMQGHRGTKKG